jgi:hypothetical protein
MRRVASWRTPASLRPVVSVADGTAERLPLDDRSATAAWVVAERLARPGGGRNGTP